MSNYGCKTFSVAWTWLIISGVLAMALLSFIALVNHFHLPNGKAIKIMDGKVKRFPDNKPGKGVTSDN